MLKEEQDCLFTYLRTIQIGLFVVVVVVVQVVLQLKCKEPVTKLN
jgi:hypothetical protein